MATHGSIGEFQNAQEDWQSYVERLQQYFVVNYVNNADKQQAILLSSVGGQTYQLIRNLLAPDKPTSKTFTELVEAMMQHHQPNRQSLFSGSTSIPAHAIAERMCQPTLRSCASCPSIAILETLSTICCATDWCAASPTNVCSVDSSRSRS